MRCVILIIILSLVLSGAGWSRKVSSDPDYLNELAAQVWREAGGEGPPCQAVSGQRVEPCLTQTMEWMRDKVSELQGYKLEVLGNRKNEWQEQQIDTLDSVY